MKKRLILCSVLVAITAFEACLFFCVLNNAAFQLPRATQKIYNYNSEFVPIKIFDIEKFSERMSMKGVTFCAELYDMEIKDNTIYPVLTNENFFEVMNISVTGGFSKEDLQNKEKVAVISSDLAVKLFFNTDVIGEKIKLFNEEFTVCGVYKIPDGLLNEFSTDGKERVYLPYTIASSYENQEIKSLCYENSSPSAAMIEQMDLSQYSTTDFGEKVSVIRNFEHILFLVLYIAFCIISLQIWFRLCKKFIFDICENLKGNYFFKSRAIPLKYTMLIATAIGIPLILIIIYILCDFSILIPSKYIPYDNIFDASHYIAKIIENSNTDNSLALTGNTYFIKLYNNSFNVLFMLLSNIIILFYVIFTNLFFLLRKFMAQYYANSKQ